MRGKLTTSIHEVLETLSIGVVSTNEIVEKVQKSNPYSSIEDIKQKINLVIDTPNTFNCNLENNTNSRLKWK